MLFFLSEEAVRAWCAERGAPLRPLVTMDQIWKLATAWYSTRLEPDARRPGADEIPGIFARIGLDDEFWNPKSSRFA